MLDSIFKPEHDNSIYLWLDHTDFTSKPLAAR